MRVLGMALAGVLVLTAPIVAHAVSQGPETGSAGTGWQPGPFRWGTGMVRTGARRPVVGVVVGTRPGGDRAVITADGFPIGDLEFPLTGSGVARVGRGITRSQIGEALTEAGATRSRPD